ncbi:DNA primase [Pendulispora albinea]|uniref:DNA primase n=1 Tax=Pendulispora albinea TaxID=2741071 RepID=A0ABZ2LML4_9BACT
MISPQTIALVRERTDIVALILESVPTLKRRGRSFTGLCPFHKEKSPSFHVNPDRGFFHCFGCKEGGSAIDFVMKLDGLTFPEAVRLLAEKAGIPIEEDVRERSEVDRQKKQRDDLYAVNNLAATFFERQLRDHPHRHYALEELARRELVPTWASGDTAYDAYDTESPLSPIDDALQAFRIGYAPAAWDGLATFLKQQGVSPMFAEHVGLLVPRSSGTGHYDRFRHRLMFAVVDPQGRVVAFSGRSLRPLAPSDDPDSARSQRSNHDGGRDDKPAKYINSPESPIYSKGQMLFGIYQARHAIREEQCAIVVEGNFDVVSLQARGVKNVVAPLGTAFTAEQAKLLKRFASRVVLLFDADAAGRKATRASRVHLRDVGLSAKVGNLPAGVDPDEFLRTKGVAALNEILAHARGMLEFLIDGALDATFTASDVHERAARVAEVSQLLAEEDDPLIKMMAKTHAMELAGRIDLRLLDGVARHVPEDAFRALEASVKRAVAKAGPPPTLRRGESSDPPARARLPARPPGAGARRDLVGALIEHPELLRDPEVEPWLELLEGVSAQTVAALAQSFDGERLDTDRFQSRLSSLDAAIRSFAAERLAAPVHESVEAAKTQASRAAGTLRAIRLAESTREIADSQKNDGDFESQLTAAREAHRRVQATRTDARENRPPGSFARDGARDGAPDITSSKIFGLDTGPKAEPEY